MTKQMPIKTHFVICLFLCLFLCAGSLAGPSDDILRLEASSPSDLRPLLSQFAKVHASDPVYLKGLNVYWPLANQHLSKVPLPKPIWHLGIGFQTVANAENQPPKLQLIVDVDCKTPCSDVQVRMKHQEKWASLASVEVSQNTRPKSFHSRLFIHYTYTPSETLTFFIRGDAETVQEIEVIAPLATETPHPQQNCPRIWYKGVTYHQKTERVVLDPLGARPRWQSYSQTEPLPEDLVAPFLLVKSCLSEIDFTFITLMLYPSAVTKVTY